MYRNVEINIPMFIGIIILIATITAALVLGINNIIKIKDESNQKYNLTSSELKNWLINYNENIN